MQPSAGAADWGNAAYMFIGGITPICEFHANNGPPKYRIPVVLWVTVLARPRVWMNGTGLFRNNVLCGQDHHASCSDIRRVLAHSSKGVTAVVLPQFLMGLIRIRKFRSMALTAELSATVCSHVRSKPIYSKLQNSIHQPDKLNDADCPCNRGPIVVDNYFYL